MLNTYRFSRGRFTRPFSTFLIAGPDARTFLQAQSTFDLTALGPGQFHLASFLDPQGRLEAYGWLLAGPDRFTYLVPPALAAATNERLNRFLISEDVTISGPVTQEWTIVLGLDVTAGADREAFRGTIFEEEAVLVTTVDPAIPEVAPADVQDWRLLTGWPSFDGSDFKPDLITNLRLFDLSVSSKGCYPGQETVSKIATRRGAAYSPVLIETDRPTPVGPILNFEKRIGEATALVPWDNRFYLVASLLRDFRVQGMTLHFRIDGSDYSGTVRYYPLLTGGRREKATELFYQATEDFKRDDTARAEEKLRLAIRIDPTFADAYESLGVMLGRLDRYPEAIGLMEELSKLDPTSVLAHTNLSMFLMKLGRIEEAEQQKSLATVKSFQKFGEEARLKEREESGRKQREGEWLQRESMFRQVLEIDAEDALANYGLGSIAVERGDWETALGYLQTVLRTEPAYSVAYLALGKAYKGLGKKDDARKTWREGIKVAAAKGDLMPANQMQFELDNL